MEALVAFVSESELLTSYTQWPGECVAQSLELEKDECNIIRISRTRGYEMKM